MSGTEGTPTPDPEPINHAVSTPTPPLEPEPQEPTPEPEPAPAEPEPETPKAEKRPWFVDRIARESARAAQLQQELDRIRSGAPAPTEQPALTDTAAIEAEIERRAAIKRQQDDFASAWGRTVEAGKKEFSDFDAALTRINDAVGDQFNRQPWIFEALNDLPNGAAVLHSLSNDLGEATRLMGLTPIKQALALAEKSRNLEPKPKQVSRAPAPITPINGAAAHEESDPDKMSMQDWLAWRTKNLQPGRR